MKLQHRFAATLLSCAWLALGLLARTLGAADAVKIEVDDGKVIQKVGEHFSGTNFCALWNNTQDSPGTIKAFSQMGLNLVRFPGGVPCEWWDWKDSLNTGWTVLTPERAWGLAKAGGAEMVFQTNICGNHWDNKKAGTSGNFDCSGEHAAEWVKFCAEKSIKVAFWEVGNEPECDAPGKEVKNKGDQGAVMAWYNKMFKEQAEAIKKADPKAQVMGPASTNTYFWWAQHNLDKFLKAHGNKEGSGLADALSIHWYPEGGGDVWEKKRGIAQGWTECMKYIKDTIAKYDSRTLPLYITEWSFSGGDKNERNAEFGNALGTADIVGMFLRTGVAGHTHFCLQKLGRNWGVLAMKQDLKPENEPAPAYFALAMCAHLGTEVLELKNPSDEKNVLSAYATKDAKGGMQVLLINKTGETQSAEIAFSGYKPSGKDVEIYSLKPATGKVTDRAAIYNGQEAPKPAEADLPKPKSAKAGATFTQELAPYELVVLNFAP
ncbi:MAG: hypothetical protein HY291_02540 [Planctomycetes bacterium]|nr:hypothetical protein [Planctomycetota bacterium]